MKKVKGKGKSPIRRKNKSAPSSSKTKSSNKLIAQFMGSGASPFTEGIWERKDGNCIDCGNKRIGIALNAGDKTKGNAPTPYR